MAKAKKFKIQWQRFPEIINGEERTFPVYTSKNSWLKKRAEELLNLANKEFEAAAHWLIPASKKRRKK